MKSAPETTGIIKTAGDGVEEASDHRKESSSRGWRFNISLVSLCLIAFVSTLDGSILATALPKIASSIEGGNVNDYVWMANCYLLAQTVFQLPLAQLCNIFGRRNPLFLSLILFMVGSGVAGGSTTASTLIAGRTVQGLGAGGIMMLIEMVVCDLVPLRERGKYLGIVLSTCSIGAVAGPVLGGALADANWRWVFYINLPIAGVVLLAMSFSLQLRFQKEPTWKRSLARVDWIGSTVFIASMSATLFGLIAGGAQYPWSSWRIITPIVLGCLGLLCFCLYEAMFSKEPSMPPVLFQNRTSSTGFALTFTMSMLISWVAFYLPFFFQSVREQDPLQSGIMFLPFQAFLIPAAIVAGLLLTKTGVYKPLHLVGFALIAIGLGLLTTLNQNTSTALWVIFQAIDAIGQGLVIPSLLPAIQSSLAESEVATSTGLFSFFRSFGYIWGVTVPGIIFNNQWDRLASQISDATVRAELGGGTAYRFASTMYEHPFSSTTRQEVVSVYSQTLRIVWIAAIPFAAISFFMVFLEKHYKLREDLDTQFGLDRDSPYSTNHSEETSCRAESKC